MASIHRKKMRSGRVVWELTHGRGRERIRLVAGDTREAAEGVLATFRRQLALQGTAPAPTTRSTRAFIACKPERAALPRKLRIRQENDQSGSEFTTGCAARQYAVNCSLNRRAS